MADFDAFDLAPAEGDPATPDEKFFELPPAKRRAHYLAVLKSNGDNIVSCPYCTCNMPRLDLVTLHLPRCSVEFEKSQNASTIDTKKKVVRDVNDPDFFDPQRCMLPVMKHNKRGKVVNSKYGFFIYTSSSPNRNCRVCSPNHIGKAVEMEIIKRNVENQFIALIPIAGKDCGQCAASSQAVIGVIAGARVTEPLKSRYFCCYVCLWDFFAGFSNPNAWKNFIQPPTKKKKGKQKKNVPAVEEEEEEDD